MGATERICTPEAPQHPALFHDFMCIKSLDIVLHVEISVYYCYFEVHCHFIAPTYVGWYQYQHWSLLIIFHYSLATGQFFLLNTFMLQITFKKSAILISIIAYLSFYKNVERILFLNTFYKNMQGNH